MAALRGRLAFALGLAAAFLGAALAGVAFFGAAAFLVGAAFLAGAAFFSPVFFGRVLAKQRHAWTESFRTLAAGAFLGASFFVAGGEAFFSTFLSDFLSFTGPEAPDEMQGQRCDELWKYRGLVAREQKTLAKRARHGVVSKGSSKELTLRLVEVTLLHTLLDSTVDVGVELGRGNVADLVVGLDVLLDGLAAAQACQHFIRSGKHQRAPRSNKT